VSVESPSDELERKMKSQDLKSLGNEEIGRCQQKERVVGGI
jgi:hypothetical protein